MVPKTICKHILVEIWFFKPTWLDLGLGMVTQNVVSHHNVSSDHPATSGPSGIPIPRALPHITAATTMEVTPNAHKPAEPQMSPAGTRGELKENPPPTITQYPLTRWLQQAFHCLSHLDPLNISTSNMSYKHLLGQRENKTSHTSELSPHIKYTQFTSMWKILN